MSAEAASEENSVVFGVDSGKQTSPQGITAATEATTIGGGPTAAKEKTTTSMA